MYKIYANDTAIWTPNDNEKKFVSPKLALEVNKLGSLSFTIYPNHKAYDLLVKMQTIISVYQDNEILFKGRIFSDKADFRKAKKVEIEGILGYFNDSIVRPYSFTGDVPDYLEMLINQHNNQMPGQKQFKLGNVTVTDPNNYITRSSSDYPKTWEEIENKLIKLLGGYIVIRYEEDGNYIDYLADFPTEETQKIEYAVNLLDLDNEVKADNLATCIIPLGASVQDDEGNSSRITIKDVNNGLDYIYDPIAEVVYGRISKTVTWDDVTLPENLLKKAQEWIKTAALLEGTLTIKAVDLHLIDDQIQAFRIGQYIPVYSVPHGINEDLLLTKFDLDLSNPANFTFSLGRTKTSFVNLQFTNNTDSKKVLQSAEQISQEVNQIRNEVGNKVDSNVGVGNTGKYLGIDALGNVVPVDPPAEFDIHSLNTKATIAENDEFPIYGPNVTENRKLLWSTIKSVLKSYFDQIYAAINHKHTISDIEDFPDLENTYAKKNHSHTVSDINDFPKINYYQGEEITVGTWFSKPLYRSVIEITDLKNEPGSYSLAHNIENITLITKVEGILVSDGSTKYLSNVSADQTDIFYTLDTITESGTGYLVVEYTK